MLIVPLLISDASMTRALPLPPLEFEEVIVPLLVSFAAGGERDLAGLSVLRRYEG